MINDDEKELLKVGAETAFKPFSNLIETLFGGAAEEIGGMLRDRFATRRQVRQLTLLKKLQAAVDRAGFKPRQIPDAIWLPAVQAASMEDDETLQDKWANLLTTAADPEKKMISKTFGRILAELSGPETRLLDSIELETSDATRILGHLDFGKLQSLYSSEDATQKELRIAIDSLKRLRLLGNSFPPVSRDDFFGGKRAVEDPYYLTTNLGTAMVAACKNRTEGRS